MSPSFKLGTNSLPMRVASKPDKTTNTTAIESTTGLLAMDLTSAGSYPRFAHVMMRFSFSLTLLVINKATAAGMKVIERIMAPSSAATTVKAMGWNIFPSTPVSAKMGR